jgi:4,5:9,10-diseco-3-hydroxy-5,9,17-trioxoandrosta-1(10),2-diene-4-oate hydrolase
MKSTLVNDFHREEHKVREEKIKNFASFAGLAVNFVREGNGAPVVMAHGLAASLHDWDEFLPALAVQGYAGYALDLLGHGDSAKPDDLDLYTAENVFAHLRDWVASLALDEPFVFIGHSLGGCMALKYALRFPEQLKALVLVNPFYSVEQLPRALRLFFRRPLFNTALIQMTPYWLFRMLIDLSSLSFGSSMPGKYILPEAVRIQTALDYKRSSPNIYNIPRTLQDLTCDLLSLTLPTLVVWGENDQTLAPASFPKLVELLPNARGVKLPAGHVPHQSHAKEFNRIVLDFLKNNP